MNPEYVKAEPKYKIGDVLEYETSNGTIYSCIVDKEPEWNKYHSDFMYNCFVVKDGQIIRENHHILEVELRHQSYDDELPETRDELKSAIDMALLLKDEEMFEILTGFGKDQRWI